MAFGKADTGLIQADRAAQTMDPMLGVSAGIGNLIGGINKSLQANQAAMAKANVDLDKEWSKGTSDSMNSNNNLTRKGRRTQSKLYKEGKRLFANAVDGAAKDEILDEYNKKINANGFIAAAQKESLDNGNNFGPGFDDTDKYFSTMYSNNKYETEEVNGQTMVKVKNPPGYSGGENGYTYFDPPNLPISMDQWTDGSTAILSVWDEQYGGRTNWEDKMLPSNFAKAFKSKMPKKMNYFQGQDLITADHSDDGNDNSFLTEFSSGNLPASYYSDINTTDGSTNYITVTRRGEGNKVEQVTFDPAKGPMGGLSKEELTGYIKGLDSNGVKDYRNQSKLNEFIKEKYSTFMGDVTSEAYDKKQKEELIKNRRYFNMPNEDGSFSMMGQLEGKFPTDTEVTAEKKKVLVSSKFATATSANMMSITGDGPQDVSQGKVEDWNQFTNWKQQLGENGDLLGNLTKTYNYDDVDISAENGVLTVAVGGADAPAKTYDFTNPDFDKNDLMKRLENHLSESKFDNFSELTTLGDDASTWNETLSKNNKSILQQLGTEDSIKIKLRNMDRTSPEFATNVIDNSVNGIAMDEKDLLQALSTRAKVDKPFANKAEYKAWFMENNNGLSESVDEANFKDVWENYKIK
tara:strand:+ start:937 stop:2838 length:1902 start_codon:yes stop_codon:yes gene_type:complete